MAQRYQKPMGRYMIMRVIVDLREIRDSMALPLMLYRKSIGVVAATMENMQRGSRRGRYEAVI